MKLLTKSNYIEGVQCPEYLWIKMNNPKKIPEPNSVVVYRIGQGTIAGKLATNLFPDFGSKDLAKAVKYFSKRKRGFGGN